MIAAWTSPTTDALYLASRAALVVGWLAVAALAWRRRPPQRGAWTACAVAALLYASVRASRWNYLVLDAGREALRALGVYDDRWWGKVLFGALLVAAALAAVVAARRARWRGPLLACGIALGLQGCLLAAETLSLEAALPGWLLAQPGRYLAEGGFVAVAAVAARRGRAQP